MVLALTLPFIAGARPARRLPSISSRRSSHVARVGSFDESAAQVRRLVDRDRKELDYDALEDNFKPDSAAAAAPSSSESTRGMTTIPIDKADKTPVSPFGPSSTAPSASPFGSSSGSSFGKKPFAEPLGLRPDMPPATIQEVPWYKQITLAQIVIVLSFTTIISLMIATFFVVLNTGAIHFNE